MKSVARFTCCVSTPEIKNRGFARGLNVERRLFEHRGEDDSRVHVLCANVRDLKSRAFKTPRVIVHAFMCDDPNIKHETTKKRVAKSDQPKKKVINLG